MNDRIVIEPGICNGRPTIRGTRITAQTILEFLGAGNSIDDALEEYPSLTREDVLACIQYSSDLMGQPEVQPETTSTKKSVQERFGEAADQAIKASNKLTHSQALHQARLNSGYVATSITQVRKPQLGDAD